MKKALVFALMFVLGLGIAAFTAPMSGSWESELTIGFRDVVVTDPGATFTIPGNTYAVSQGTVTIGDQVVSGTYLGSSYTVTVPGGTYVVGPWDLTVEGGTYDVTDATVTIPAQDVVVQLPDGECTVTVPEFEFEIPTFDNKIANISFPVEEKEIALDLPHVEYSYSGTVGYTYVLYLQTSSTVLQAGVGTFPLEVIGDTELAGPVYNCITMCWEWPDSPYPTVPLPGFHREIHPDGKTFQVDIDPETVVVKQDDAIFNGFVLLVGRTASGWDSLGNRVEIIVDSHNLDFTVVVPETIEIPTNWAYTPALGFEGHYLVFEIPAMNPALTMPAGWNRCCEPGLPELDRPTITVGLNNLDVYFYQVTDEITATTPAGVAGQIYDAILAGHLDKMGLCFVNTESKTYEFDALDNVVTIPFDDLEGTALLGTYATGTQTITIPERVLTCECEGQEITIIIPAQDITVTGQTVTIPDQTVTVEADEIVIPDFTFTITVDDQVITITIPGGSYAVSAQTVTIPSQTINIPGWTQTITKVPTLAFTSTLIVDYTVCGWVFNSTSKFDDTGWMAQSFAADGALGAFSLGSKLVFSPAGASFTSWDSTVSVSIAGVAFDAEFYLGALGSGWTFGASGGVGDCDFGATVYLNMDSSGNLIADDYCFCFSSVDFDISFPFACIDLVDITIGFSTAGFDGVTFAVTGIVVPGLPWLTFDLNLTFDDGEDGKEMVLTPAIDLGTFVCITLYYEYQGWASTSGCGEPIGAKITGLYFYGIGLDYTWNGVTFTSVSSFDVDKNKTLTGNADYWEVFTISSEADACCGGAFDFSVSTYFECESEMLFDWAESSIKLSMGLGSNYTGWTGLTVTDAGLTEWKIGFKVIW